MKQKSKWLLLAVGVALAALLLSFTSFAADCKQIRRSVLRLHVLANSDNEGDQQLKLLVRDAVTAQCAGLFDAAADSTEARQTAAAALQTIEQVAEQTLRAHGCTHSVRAELTNMYFATRTYDAVTLPAGMYDAVRITLGKGEGKNWWCVVFPPLCVSAALEHKTMQDVLDPSQLDVVQNSQNYRVRFKLVEWWESLANTVRGWFD